MVRSRTILWTLLASLALILFTGTAADAFWRRGCWGCGYGSYGSYYAGYSGYAGYWGGGGYGSTCSSCYTPACSSCVGGGCYSSSYWGYPTYSQSYYPAYYSPPVYGGCSTCLGSATTTRTNYAPLVSSVRPATPTPTPAATGQVVFSVTVPADTKVYINDRPTTSTGTQRSYTARDLLVGYQYGFTVRSERVVDGRLVSETQSLRLTAGQTGQLAFNLTPAAANVATQQVRPMVKLASAH